MLVLASCGSNSSGNGAGTGVIGGSGNPPPPVYPPTITLVTPSQLNTYAATTNPTVYGTNFTANTLVEINGVAQPTFPQSSTELWTSINSGTLATPGVYSVTVTGASPSNTLPLTVYSEKQGPPEPFIALPGFYTGIQNAPVRTAIDDLNGDGYGDVVICAGPASQVGTAILFGEADGTLAPPQFLPQGGDTVAIGDVNGDGFPDIILGNYPAVGANSNGSSITVYLNDGAGNFSLGATQTFAGAYPDPMVFADVLGTGRNDLLLAVSNPDTLYLFPNQGNGTFGQPITLASTSNLISFVVADFNGDGKPDIAYSGVDSSITSSSTHLLINQGNGIFDDVVPAALASTGGQLVAGDFNNDGKLDLAIEIENQRTPIPLEIFLNNGNNSFSLASTISLGTLSLYAPYKFVVGDFDHDGLLDIAGENSYGGPPDSILFLWGDGTGNFTSQQVVGPSGSELATGDINGDGIPDLVIPDGSLSVTILTGHTGRTYPQPKILSVPLVNAVAIGDVNGDGFPDLLFVGDLTTPSSIFLNDGHGNFSIAGRPPIVGDGGSEKLLDLNRSGKADLVGLAAISGGEAIVIYPATGEPNYSSSPITVPIPTGITNFSSFQVADLDGDELPDLIFDEGIGWNQGSYQFTFTSLNMNGVLRIGDVNNDGRPDLIAANGTFLNQGNHKFTNIYINGLPVTAGDQVVFGDFNGDGIVDVAFADLVVGQVIGVAYGRGDGTFYVQSDFATSESEFGNVVKLATGDFNRDGLTDLVAPLLGGVNIMVLTSAGNGQFANSSFATGFLVQDMFEADLNMDGKPDLIILPYTPANYIEIVFGQ